MLSSVRLAPFALGAHALRPASTRPRIGSGRAVPPRRMRSATTSYGVAVAPPVAFQGGVSLLAWSAEAAGRASTALVPWTEFFSPQAFSKPKGPLPVPTSLGLAPPESLEDARARLVCNPLRFAANYAVLAAGATALSALARPLDLLLCAALALALFAGGSQRAFDAAWPYLHRWAVFDVMGEPLRVDGVCVKLNGFNVGNEQTLWGLPRLVWGFAAAALAAVLVARNPLALATTAMGALSASSAIIITHALLKPLPEFGEGSWRQTQLRLAAAAVTNAARNAPAPRAA